MTQNWWDPMFWNEVFGGTTAERFARVRFEKLKKLHRCEHRLGQRKCRSRLREMGAQNYFGSGELWVSAVTSSLSGTLKLGRGGQALKRHFHNSTFSSTVHRPLHEIARFGSHTVDR